jgi:hypothetical protein
MSPSPQEITLKNTAVESSMQMDSRGAVTKASLSSCTSCTEILFILFPAQKRTISLQTYFWPLEAPFAHWLMLHPHFMSAFPNMCTPLFLHGLHGLKKKTFSARTLVPVYNSMCHHNGEDFNNNNNNNNTAAKTLKFHNIPSPMALQPNMGHSVLIPEVS